MKQRKTSNKCPLCDKKTKKSGPYLHRKDEGQSVYKGPSEVYYTCMNEKCKNFYKSIRKWKPKNSDYKIAQNYETG